MNLSTQPRPHRTDRDRINAAFTGAGWRFSMIGPDDVRFDTVTGRGWRQVEISYEGEQMFAALLTSRAGEIRSVRDVNTLLAAAGIPMPGQGDPENVADTDTFVCILTDHMTGAVLAVELLSEAPQWDTADTADGVWIIRKGRVNGGRTVTV